MQFNQILGYEEFQNWCGGWPSFHDSEIAKLELNRHGQSKLTIYVLGGTKPIMGPRSDDRYVPLQPT